MKKATSEFSQHHKTRQPNEKAQKSQNQQRKIPQIGKLDKIGIKTVFVDNK